MVTFNKLKANVRPPIYLFILFYHWLHDFCSISNLQQFHWKITDSVNMLTSSDKICQGIKQTFNFSWWREYRVHLPRQQQLRDQQETEESLPGLQVPEVPQAGDAQGGRQAGQGQGRPPEIPKVRNNRVMSDSFQVSTPQTVWDLAILKSSTR